MSDAAQILNSEFEEFAYFNSDEIKTLRNQVFEKEVRGKIVPFVKCLVREKDIQLKPEEAVWQLWLARLFGAIWLSGQAHRG